MHNKKRTLASLRRNRRGISTIIATLLLILLTVAIVGILWVIIRNIVSSASGGISLGGLTLDLKIQNASVGQNDLSVLVQRQPGAGALSGVNFIAYDGENYEVIKRNATLAIYEGKEFTLPISEINLSAVKTVSVAPIYLSGGAEQIGQITDTYTFGAIIPSGGTGGAVCGNDLCESGETTASCPADCEAGGGSVCGNEVCELDETSYSCPADCTPSSSPVCGNYILESGEGCDDGNLNNGDGCSSICQDETPGAVCGNEILESGEGCDDGNLDNGDGCSSACQIEASGPICGNDLCESGETLVSCPADCTPAGPVCGNDLCESGENSTSCPSDCIGCVPTTCLEAGYQCGTPTDGCGGLLNCGNCSALEFCNTNFLCETYVMANSGTILSVWPSGATLFFDSEDLPKSESVLIDYNDGLHYARFPGSSETDCIKISLAAYLPENNRAYIKLYSVADITAGANYEIWNSQAGCLAAQ